MIVCNYCLDDARETEATHGVSLPEMRFMPAIYESVGDNLATCAKYSHIATFMDDATGSKNPVIRRTNQGGE